MLLKSPKFIYFDLDDTLLNHKKAEQAGLKDVHDHFSIFDGVSLEELVHTYHNINKALWERYGRGEIDRQFLHQKRFEDTLEALKLDSSLYEKAGKVYMNYYRTHWEWIDGAKEAYEKIRDSYATGIITNGFAETQRMKLNQFGFDELARHIVISEDIGVMKPHPKIFDFATELCGCEREEILYVGDSYTSDVVGGSNAGWQVAWYSKSDNDTHKMNANLIFTEFGDLLKALEIE